MNLLKDFLDAKNPDTLDILYALKVIWRIKGNLAC